MIKNYFKIALRNIQKNQLYSAINILGLVIGLAACLLIGIYITHELGYDKFNKNANRIVGGFEFQKAEADGRTAWRVVAIESPPLTPSPPFTPPVEETVTGWSGRI